MKVIGNNERLLAVPAPEPVQAASPRLLSAQGTKTLVSDDTREANLHAYVELLRSDIRSQRVAIITELMNFSEAEDAKFWPVYREYETELAKVNDDRLALIKEYAAQLREIDRRGRRPARPRCPRRRRPEERAQGALLRPVQIGAVAEGGRSISSSREPDAVDSRPPDCGVSPHRPMTSFVR